MNNIYDEVGKYYDVMQRDIDYDQIIDLINCYNPHQLPIFDFGCGTGEVVTRLAKKGVSFFGYDISPTMVDITNQKLSSITDSRVVVGDVNSLSKLEQIYGCVIMTTDTLNYIIDKDDITQLGYYFYNCLVTNGYLIVDIQAPRNLIDLDNYHEVKVLSDDLSLDWYSYRLSKIKPLIRHQFKLYKDDELIAEEEHTQAFHSINYYRSKWFKYFKLEQTYKTPNRYYLVFKRR